MEKIGCNMISHLLYYQKAIFGNADFWSVCVGWGWGVVGTLLDPSANFISTSQADCRSVEQHRRQVTTRDQPMWQALPGHLRHVASLGLFVFWPVFPSPPLSADGQAIFLVAAGLADPWIYRGRLQHARTPPLLTSDPSFSLFVIK